MSAWRDGLRAGALQRDRGQRAGVTASRYRRLRRALALPLVLVLIWWAAFALGDGGASLYVSLGRVLETGWHLAGTALLWSSIGGSLARTAAGFFIGGAAGVLVGVLAGALPLAQRLLGPSLHALRQVSLFAWVLLIMVWFGLGEASKVVFVSIAAFFPIMLNTAGGVAGIGRDLLEVVRVLRFTRAQTFFRLILPSAAAVDPQRRAHRADQRLGSDPGCGIPDDQQSRHRQIADRGPGDIGNGHHPGRHAGGRGDRLRAAFAGHTYGNAPFALASAGIVGDGLNESAVPANGRRPE
ncbi:MAG: ABC transporter permease subunit [Pseudoxanthomonas sp.]